MGTCSSNKSNRCTKFLLINAGKWCTASPTDGKQKAQMKEWMPEKENMEFHIQAIPNGNRNLMVKNSQDRSSSSSLAPPLPTLDLPNTQNFFRNEGGRWPACRTTVCKWYHTGKCTRCTKCTSAMQVNKKELWSGATQIWGPALCVKNPNQLNDIDS